MSAIMPTEDHMRPAVQYCGGPEGTSPGWLLPPVLSAQCHTRFLKRQVEKIKFSDKQSDICSVCSD